MNLKKNAMKKQKNNDRILTIQGKKYIMIILPYKSTWGGFCDSCAIKEYCHKYCMVRTGDIPCSGVEEEIGHIAVFKPFEG